MKIVKLYILIPLLLIISNAIASEIDNTIIENKIVQNRNPLNTSVNNAKIWNLSDADWRKYQTLMQGEAGYYYKDLTPPEVLGYYSENDQELKYYAEIYAKQEHTKIVREIRFNNAFSDAARKLYAGEPVIKKFDISGYTPVPKKTLDNYADELVGGDHLVLFANASDGKNNYLHRLINLVSNKKVVLDIFLLNSKDNNDIRRWAALNQIPFELTMSNKITLNIDKGRLRKVNPQANETDLPYLLLVHDNSARQINLGL